MKKTPTKQENASSLTVKSIIACVTCSFTKSWKKDKECSSNWLVNMDQGFSRARVKLGKMNIYHHYCENEKVHSVQSLSCAEMFQKWCTARQKMSIACPSVYVHVFCQSVVNGFVMVALSFWSFFFCTCIKIC